MRTANKGFYILIKLKLSDGNAMFEALTEPTQSFIDRLILKLVIH